ncbi:MAG: hypothetical protein JWQ72_2722, partial [Polaromonas sp.]|nr:hypothetical protein [Polaromonas sp.]
VSHLGRVAVAESGGQGHPTRYGRAIARVPGMLGRRSVLATLAATAALLLLLAWHMRGAGGALTYNAALVLRWLLLALTALTLPHLILISRCAPWLQAQGKKQPRSLSPGQKRRSQT